MTDRLGLSIVIRRQLVRGLMSIIIAAVCPTWCFARDLAITFDDLPVQNNLPSGVTGQSIVEALIAALHEAHAPAIGFINGVQDNADASTKTQLALWRQAGFQVGNHTWSHRSVDETSVPNFERDILKIEPTMLSNMRPGQLKWFRFPYLEEGKISKKRKAIRLFLAHHKYHIGSVSIDFSDYAYNEAFVRCYELNNITELEKIRSGYMNSARQLAEKTIFRARSHVGREPTYILLLHAGLIEAATLPDLLLLYRQMGFRFVSIDQAESDPIYLADLQPMRRPGKVWRPESYYDNHPESPEFQYCKI